MALKRHPAGDKKVSGLKKIASEYKSQKKSVVPKLRQGARY